MITFTITYRDLLIFFPTAFISFCIGAYCVALGFRNAGYRFVRRSGKSVVEKVQPVTDFPLNVPSSKCLGKTFNGAKWVPVNECFCDKMKLVGSERCGSGKIYTNVSTK